MSKVVDLYVYPIKACQPVRLKRMEVGDAGGVLDRIFCVVDLDGDFFPCKESLSMRSCPPLGGIRVRIRGRNTLIISAECMKKVLEIPIDVQSYENEENVVISCSGLSTTSNGGWSLGKVDAKHCGKDAEEWFTCFLRMKMTDRFAKKKVMPRFGLCRSVGQGRYCSKYAGALQLPFSDDVSAQKAGKASPFNMTKVPVLENDRVNFADSFPFLVTSVDSLNVLRDAMNVSSYPMTAFRPNIVVETGGKAFEEEKWSAFRFSSSDTIFRQLKLCPRCTVPSRDPTSGEFLLKDNKLLFMKTLRNMFPQKTKDSEWGEEWEGATFGVLCGHNGTKGEIRVGDSIVPVVFMHRPNAHGDGSFAADEKRGASSCILS